MSKWVPRSTTPTHYDYTPERQGGKGGNRAQIRKVAWVARNGTPQPQEQEEVVSSDTQKKRRDAKRPSTIKASTDSSATDRDNIGVGSTDWWTANDWSNEWGEWDAEGEGDASEWSSYVTVRDKLVRVELSKAELGDQDLKALAHYLDIILNRLTNWTKDAHDMYVLNIDLSMNSYITDRGVSQHLAPLLQRWPNVHRLKLFKNCLGAESIRALAPWLARGFCRELHLSDLLGPQVTTESVIYMLQLIFEKRNYPTGRAQNTPLWLRLEHNGIPATTDIVDRLTKKGLQICLKGEHCKPHKCAKRHAPPHVHLVQFHVQSSEHSSRASTGGKPNKGLASPSSSRAHEWDEEEWAEDWHTHDWEEHWWGWNPWEAEGQRRSGTYWYDDEHVEDSVSKSDRADGGTQHPQAAPKQKTLFDPKSAPSSSGPASTGSPANKSKRKEVPLTAADLLMGCASYGRPGASSAKKGSIAASPGVTARDVIVGKQQKPKNVLETHGFPTLGAPESRMTNLNALTSQAAWGAAPSAVFENKPIGPKKKEQPFSFSTSSDWPTAAPSSSSEIPFGFSLPPPANAQSSEKDMSWPNPSSSSEKDMSWPNPSNSSEKDMSWPNPSNSSEKDMSWPNPSTATIRPVLPPPASSAGLSDKGNRVIGAPIPSTSILPPPGVPPPAPPSGTSLPLPQVQKSEEEIAQLEIRPLSFAEKEILKTHRKIRDIDKIEEAIANEEKVEKNQLAKVQKKSEITVKLRELEKRSRAQGGRTLLELQQAEKTLKLIEERNRKLEEQRAAITVVQAQARVWLARREAARKVEERRLRLIQEEEDRKLKEIEHERQRILQIEEEERRCKQKIEDERKRKEAEEAERKRKLIEEERERARKIAEEEAARKRAEADAARKRMEAEHQRIEAAKQAERKKAEEQRKAKEREEQQRMVEQLEKQQREAHEHAIEAERIRREQLALQDAEVAERRRVRKLVEGLPVDRWFYITPRGSIEGPFDLARMRAWRNQGYFQKNLMVSINWYHNFYPLHTIFSDWERCFDALPLHPEQELVFVIPLVKAGKPIVFAKNSKEKADMAQIQLPPTSHAQPKVAQQKVVEKMQDTEQHKVEDKATTAAHVTENKPKPEKKQDIAENVTATNTAIEAPQAAPIGQVSSVDPRTTATSTSAGVTTQESSTSTAHVSEVKTGAKLPPITPPVPNFPPPTPVDAAPAPGAAAKALPSAPSPRPAPAMPDFPPPEPTSAQKQSEHAIEAETRLHDKSSAADVKVSAHAAESVSRGAEKVPPEPVRHMPKGKPAAPAPLSPKLPPSKLVLPPPKASATVLPAPKTSTFSKKKTKDDYVIPAPPLTTCPPPPKDLETGWHSPQPPSPPSSAISPPPSTAVNRDAAAKPTSPTPPPQVAEGSESAVATFLKRAGLDTAAVEKATADAATAHVIPTVASGEAAAPPILPPLKEKSKKLEKHASKGDDDDEAFLKEQRKKEKKAKKEAKEAKEEKMEKKESGMAQAAKEAKRIRDQQLEEEREKEKDVEAKFDDGEMMHEVQALEQRFVGLIIGKAGETIKSFKKATGCSIEIDQNLPEGMPRVIIYRGTRKQISAAKKLVEQLLQKTKDDEKSRDSSKLDGDGLPWRRDHARSVKKSSSKEDGPPVLGSLTGATESLGRPAWMSRRSTAEEELGKVSAAAVPTRSTQHTSDPQYQTYARNLMLAWRQKIMKGRAYEIPEMMVSMSTMPRSKLAEDTKDHHKLDRSGSKADKLDASPKKESDPAS